MTSFQNLHQPTGRMINLEGIDYLFFGGTAYLGLLSNPEYTELYRRGIDKYGLNNGTSRSNNVQLGIYQEAESHLAQRFGFESSALFSSGYLAAQTAVRTLKENRTVIYAPRSHPALWLDENPIVSQQDFSSWINHTVEFINHSDQSEFLIAANAMDNLTPELFDFSPLKQVNPNKDILLLLDDSHGIAVLKKNKPSVDHENFGTENLSLVLIASLAKGLGTDAGVVLSNEQIIAKIKKHPIFLGASPSAPAAFFALVKGEKIYLEAFEKMQNNNRLLARITNSLKLNHIENFPVFSSEEPLLAKHLMEQHLLISSFPYPLETSPLLNRIVITALHGESDVRHLGEILCLEKLLIL